MGLRMWRDPDDDNVIAEDAAAKLDRAAAARRSTIRREPSIRPGRDSVPPQSISVFLRSRHQNMLRTRERLRQEERETDSQIAQLQAELERLRRNRLRNRLRMHEELEASRAGREEPDINPSTEPHASDENDEANNETPNLLDTARQPLPRASRESNLRFEVSSSIPRSSSPWRYQAMSRATMPSPPRSSDHERRDMSIPDGPIPGDTWSTSTPQMPALTEGFAPARSGPHISSRHLGSHRDDGFQGLETPPPESWENSYAPLRRVGHNSPRPLPRVDGLGDRRRSLSPFSDRNEEETWMSTLLTTMDTSRSSSANSLGSSRTDALERSNTSSQTTSTSFGEIGSLGLLDDMCELDLPEGITENDVREIRERHSGPARHHSSDRTTYNQLWSIRNHMDRVGSTESGVYDAIRDRLIRRQPIPQDWWVSVGLPPDFGNMIGE